MTDAPKKLNATEYMALSEADGRPGGWGLFRPKTTERLAGRGFFIKAKHSAYGMQWQITDAGRKALHDR